MYKVIPTFGFLIFILMFGYGKNKDFSINLKPAIDTISLTFGETLFEDGKSLLKQQKYVASQEKLQKAVTIFQQIPAYEPEQLLAVYLALGEALKNQTDYEAAKSCLLEGLNQTATKIASKSSLPADVYLLLGEVYRYLGDYPLALKTIETSFALYQEAENVPNIQLGKAYNMLGIINFHFRDHKKAMEAYEKALDYYAKKPGNESTEMGITYCNIGNVLYKSGNTKKSKDYFQRGGAILIKNRASYTALTRYYNGLGVIYYLRGDYEKSLDYYQKALEASLHGKESTPRHSAIIYLNIGGCYTSLGKYKQARLYISKAEKVFKNLFGEKHFYFAKALIREAKIEESEGNLIKARDLLFKSTDIFENYFNTRYPDIVKINYLLTSVYLKLKQPEKAFQLYEKTVGLMKTISSNKSLTAKWILRKADILIDLDQEAEAMASLDTALSMLKFDKPNSSQPKDNFVALRLLKILNKQGNIYASLYQKHNQLSTLKKAKVAYLKAIQILEKVRNGIQTESSRQFALEDHFSLFSGGMNVLNQLYQLTQNEDYKMEAFNLAEKSKGLLVTEALETAKLKELAKIPASILEKERQLKSKIALYEKLRIEENKKEQPIDSVLVNVNDLIFYLKNDLYVLQDSMDTQFNLLANERQHNKTINISEVRAILPNQNSALIEYFISDTFLYTFTFYNQQCFWDKREIPNDFKNNLIAYCKDLSQPNSSFDNSKGSWLTQILLDLPLSNLPLEKVENLIIIPDSYLGYLPFGALPHPTKKSDYLIGDFNFSYAYAIHLLNRQMEQKASKAPKILAGFAPKYSQSNPLIAQVLRSAPEKTLIDLPGAKREVDQIASLFHGDSFSGVNITESCFRQLASDYRILHLSMHAELDDDIPLFSKFVFNTKADTLHDGALYANELYHLPLKAELAVLSACNTGFGAIKKGEGIISLSRAFMYAGVPATVMSLWKVPDAATSEIMTSFYQHLKEGTSKDEALRLAKLSYLNNVPSSELRHPFYWAGFIAAGNMESIRFSPNNYKWIGLGILSFFLLFLLFKNHFKF